MQVFSSESIEELKQCLEAYEIPKTEETVKAFILGFASEDALTNWHKAADTNLGQSKFNLGLLANELLARIK